MHDRAPIKAKAVSTKGEAKEVVGKADALKTGTIFKNLNKLEKGSAKALYFYILRKFVNSY